MFQPQMSPRGHLSKSCRRRVFPAIKDENASSPADYSDPLYLSETYAKLVSQIRNLKKEIDPLVIVFQRLQGELDPDFSDSSTNIEITRKISSLQAQQYDFDEQISNMRRQYSYEAKEKLDLELNHYRVVLNESRFDLNETNKMIKKAKIELQNIQEKSLSKKNIEYQNQLKEMNNKLNLLRETESDLVQQIKDINSTSNNYFYDQIDCLINTLKLIKGKSEMKKSELRKLKVSFENQKKILMTQIESKNKQRISSKQELNFKSNYSTSLRRVVAPSSRKSTTEKSTKVQFLPGIGNNIHSCNVNTNCSSSSGNRPTQQKVLNRSKTPRRNELEHSTSHSSHKLTLSVSPSPITQSVTTAVLPPPKPSKKTNPRNQSLNFKIADPTVKIVKMQKSNDEFNDFISFS